MANSTVAGHASGTLKRRSSYISEPGSNLPQPLDTRKRLRITIPSSSAKDPANDLNNSSPTSGKSYSSLFSASSTDSFLIGIDTGAAHCTSNALLAPALLTAPSTIKGLFSYPALLPTELADRVSETCRATYFSSSSSVNQVMLFGRFCPDDNSSSASGLPPILLSLLDHLSVMLRPLLPGATYSLLFPEVSTQARQAIINLYRPGEGITPHVDLLGRYADGIIGVSLGSGCVMRFDEVSEAAVDHPLRYDLYLPERSVIVLSEEARYNWTHGIDKRTRDYVSTTDATSTAGPNGEWLQRGTRLSVTFRWMLAGADVVGES